MQEIYKYYKRLIILGAGPAGLAALSEAANLGVECVLIDFNNYGAASVDANLSTVQDLKVEKSISRFGGTARLWGNQIAYLSSQDKSNWKEIGGVTEDFFSLINLELEKFLLKNLKCKVNSLELFQRKEINTSLYQTQTYYPKNKSVINQLKVKTLLSKTRLIEKEISKLEIVGNNVSAIRFSDDSQFNVELNDAVIVALGCVESVKLISKSLINPDEKRELFFGGIVDHPAGNVLIFQMPRLARKVPKRHKRRSYKNLFEIVEENNQIFRSARCEIKLADEEIPWSVALRELLLGFKPSRLTIVIRYVLRRLLPHFVFSRMIQCKYLVWIQIEQLPNPKMGISFAESEPWSNWRVTEADKIFILRASNIMQKYIEDEFQPSRILQIVSKDTIESEFVHVFHPSSLLSSNVELSSNRIQSDILGRIRGLENCRVVSAAIFPTSGWFNPTLTLMLLSKIITRSLLVKGYFQESVKC
jgi:hypothetical protein